MTQSSSNNFIHEDTRIFGNDIGIYYRAANGKLTFKAAGENNALRYFAFDAAGVPDFVVAPTFSIPNDSITFAQLQNVPTATFIGRSTAGSGDPESLTATQARTVLQLGTAALANIGIAAGDIAVLGAGGFFDPARIPALRAYDFVVVANTAARLALTSSQVQLYDDAYESDTNRVYKLIASDPSLIGSWIPISYAVIDASAIQSGLIDPARLGTGTADSTTILYGDRVYRPAPTGKDPLVVLASTGGTLAVNTRYYANHTSRSIQALSTTAAVGSTIEMTDILGNGFRITQAAGQRIYLPTGESTTLGTSGYIENPLGDGISTPLSKFCTVKLECIGTDNTWLLTYQSAVIDRV